ncbi:hypothetical protein NMY22_g18911 [Coprinellus aureogranulatus]|nr:hypothetical protein NMY22_g18911 [Coprinellus aureogranulatus]
MSLEYMSNDPSSWAPMATSQQDQVEYYSQMPELSGHQYAAYPPQQGLADSTTPMVSTPAYNQPFFNPAKPFSPGICWSAAEIGGEETMESVSEESEDGLEQVVNVSIYFHPAKFPELQCDLLLRSADGVHFYVHKDKFDALSQATVPTLLQYLSPDDNSGIIVLPDTGQVLTIILHLIYGLSCSHLHPTCDDLISSIDRLAEYGVPPKPIIQNNHELYNLLLIHGGLRPIDIYSLAGHYDVENLATQVSSHLLGYPLSQLDDKVAIRMGPIYLRRLFILHTTRIDTLKRVVQQAPTFHPKTKECGFEKQKRVTRAWAMGATYLAWELRADISTHLIRAVFEPLAAELDCEDCKKKMLERLHNVLADWAAVKTTI